jgi:hypothetical protein
MDNQDKKPFIALPPVAVLSTPKLDARQSALLLECVNGVRSGEHHYSVAITYQKQTKAKPRIAGEHYQPLPGVQPIFHEGTLVAAPSNKKGEVYLLVADAARAPVQGDSVSDDDATGWTAFKLTGLDSFRVLPNGKLPGPLALAREEAKAQALNDVAAAIAKVQAQ